MVSMAAVGAILLLLTASAAAQGQLCPPGCECVGKDGGKYRVNCSSGDVELLASLLIPQITTQLSILGNRRLTTITKDDLLSLTKLDKLNLSSNAISSIEPDAFRNLQKLTRLDLSNNRLTRINNDTFAGLQNLKRLSLSGNQFTTIEEGVLDPLTLLSRIDFASQHLTCDCRMKWIVRWMDDREVNIPDTLCLEPPSMRGIQVRNLNRANLNCEWPEDLRVFELQPSNPQMVFAGDSLPINCLVSNENVRGVYWYRQGIRVQTNATTKVVVDTDRSDPLLLTVTLRLNQLAADKTGTWTCVAETDKGNVTKSINVFVAIEFCPRTEVRTKKGTYKWPRASINSRLELLCKSGDNGAKVYYSCNAEGKWVELDMKACKYMSHVTQLLKDLSLSDFNGSTSLDMVKTLMEMLSQPTEHIADKMDVVYIARVLNKISSAYDHYHSTKNKIPAMVYNITSLMMNVNSSLLLEAEKAEESCTSMRGNLQTVVNFMLERNEFYNIYTDNIALHARKIRSPSSFTGLICTTYQNSKMKTPYLADNFFCTIQQTSPDLATSTKQNVDAMIHIPGEVAEFSTGQRPLKLVVLIYRNDKLYQSIPGHSSSTTFVPSSVISANVIGVEVKDLTSTVLIALPRKDYVTTVPKVKAVYWEKTESMWKTNGCRISNTVEQSNHNLSMAECDHLSSFSLLQEEPIVVSTTEIADTSYVFLKPQIYVGAIFLSICLLAVIFTYICSYRTINLSRKLKHALINTCFSILFLKVVFLVGIRSRDTQCKIIGMAIHYFSVTTIFWITVTTWNIYRKVSGRGVRRVRTEETVTPLPPNPMLKFYLFAWGVPVIICGITGAVSINLSSDNAVGPLYCFIDWDPGRAAFYGVIGLCFVGNFILYICICTAKNEPHTKVYAEEITVLNADGFLEPQAMDDSVSTAGSIKSSIADNEYRPLAQLSGIIMFSVLYMLMWASGAVSIVLPELQQYAHHQMEVVLSFLYMILCIILGIFTVVFYCLARNDTRATWNTCCKMSDDPTSQHPRSNTNINVISHANAQNSLKGDNDSCSSLQTSSVNNQSNPLMQIMQYHKKAMTHSVACSNSKGDASVQGTADEAPVFFNLRQNGVAKRYWEKQRASRDKDLNNSMMSVPETSRMQTHSPTNTEPTQHMSIEIQIKSHASKPAKRHRLGSTNSEPADVRNNIYHSMPKSPHQLNIPSSSHSRHREPTIGQSRTPSEGGTELRQFYRYPPEMWQSSVPRSYSHRTHGPPHVNGYMKQPYVACEEPVNKQSYVHGYLKSMKDVDNSDDESHYSHRSRKSSQRSRHRPHRHRQQADSDNRQISSTALHESYMSLQSHGTVKSHQSSRSGRSAYRQRAPRVAAEEKPLLQMPQPVQQREAEEDKLNINHSSSDNNSSHYACTPIPEAKKINNIATAQCADRDELVYSVPHQQELRVDVPNSDLSAMELHVPEEGIYENARNIIHHERPVYTNLEELRQRAAAAAAAQAAMSPSPSVNDYELPIYENLFSLNEYDTLKKQKHHVNKGLPINNQVSSNRDLRSPQVHDSSL